jgi:1-deoxy-D-xylulose-5-phosphate synthase
MGSAVLEFMADNNYSARLVRLGIPDKIIEHGEQQELWAECGYDADHIAAQVKLLGIPQAKHIIAS